MVPWYGVLVWCLGLRVGSWKFCGKFCVIRILNGGLGSLTYSVCEGGGRAEVDIVGLLEVYRG
jgi:hypothetical protein